MSTDPSSGVRTIAGFWRRLGAFFLDCLILGAIGIAVGFFLAEEFARLGPWGRLLGFSVAIAYFGTLNSRLTGGQTLGKRLLKIKVVAKDGTPLSVPKSFLRFLPLGAAWFLNNAQFPESVLISFWAYLLSIVVFGLGLSIVYLYVFNRKSRQSLHDLLVGSYVVSADAAGPVVSAAPSPLHLAICVLLLVASGVTPYFTKNLAASEPYASLMNVLRAVSSEPWVVHAQVNKGKTFMASTGKVKSTTSYLRITAYSKDPDIKIAARAKQLAQMALSTDSSAGSLDVIQVILVYGYDIGIASSWRSQNTAHSPAEWLAQ
jgi:uncharacterized RDD family membrane protein YckC